MNCLKQTGVRLSETENYTQKAGRRNFFLHFDSAITINGRNLAPPTLPDVLLTGR